MSRDLQAVTRRLRAVLAAERLNWAEQAEAWLREALSDGPMAARDLRDDAEAAGITRATRRYLSEDPPCDPQHRHIPQNSAVSGHDPSATGGGCGFQKYRTAITLIPGQPFR